MAVTFSKKESNFNKQNLADLLSTVPDKTINYLINHPTDYIKVVGDIHNSQWTADNPKGLYWFKIKGVKNGEDIPELRSIHIYVCFRQFKCDKKTSKYMPGKCIVPKMIGNTGLPDLSGLFGSWEFSKITYSH